MSGTFPKYASVILDVSIDKTLDYGIPEHLLGSVQRGVRVEVPLRGFPKQGYVFSVNDKPSYTPVKPIQRVSVSTELFTKDLFELALWMARYYCAPLRQVFKAILPSTIRKENKEKQQLYVMRNKTREELMDHCLEIRNKNSAQATVIDAMLQVKKGILLTELLEITKGTKSPIDTLVKKGFLTIDIVRVDRSPLMKEEYFQTKSKKLNDEQQEAFNKIAASLEEQRFETHLLHGVTGSGKTEIYLQAIEKALLMGKSTIMLVPEIALTGQTIERFRSRFEGQIAILHHRLSQGERFDEWHKIRRGEAKIVIGARSAVFSPVENPGLLIVDEEHEQSYKQSEETPCYNARDAAVMRGKLTNSTVILGSATPSLESYNNAKSGKYTLSKLHLRADAATMPTVRIVDMKVENQKAKGFTSFSEALLDGIKKRHAIGEQTILFLNRRGYHTSLLCQDCGTVVRCKDCDIPLTFHKGDNYLCCHLCSFQILPPPTQCPACKKPNPLKFKGVGTEQIQRALHAVLPDIRTIRMDADTTKHKGSHQRLLREFGTGKADVLIGTQMIAKGLHFPQVTLVGVLNSDSSLNLPDFRASETAFQLITQVSGRAGRGAVAGEVIIQTFMPDNQTILHASKQDFDGFYAEEIGVREMFQYPPFTQMAKIGISGPDEAKEGQVLEVLRRSLVENLPNTFEAQPVVPCGYAKVKGKYRYQFLVRGPSIYPISRALETLLPGVKLGKDSRISIDINPASTYF